MPFHCFEKFVFKIRTLHFRLFRPVSLFFVFCFKGYPLEILNRLVYRKTIPLWSLISQISQHFLATKALKPLQKDF